MKAVNYDQMKQLDDTCIEKIGISGIVLMENAGIAVLEEVLRALESRENKEVVIVCGHGNNGGDGFVLARHLFNRGIPVKVFVTGNLSNMSKDAKINYEILQKLDIDLQLLIGANNLKKFAQSTKYCGIIVDAIFGIGLNKKMDVFVKEVIHNINQSQKEIISIDIPSGIDAGTGKIYDIAVKATKTVVLQLPKVGNINYPGVEYVGKMVIKDIGIPKKAIDGMKFTMNMITEDMVKNIIPLRKKNTHKGDYGKAYVVAGSTGMTGAAVLCCEAALRSGVGYVKLPVPQSLNTIIETRLTEAITIPMPETKKGIVGINAFDKIIKTMKESDVIAMGPGSGRSRELEELLRNIIEEVNKPLVLDADALNALSNRSDLLESMETETVMTPHPGEMSRLTKLEVDYIEGNRIEVAKEFAKKWNSIIVLKGTRTVVAEPKGEVYINQIGNPGMATSGTGDVLTGIITSFIAQGIRPVEATVAAVYVHAKAGDEAVKILGEYGLLASDIVKQIPATMKKIIGK